MEDDSWYSVAFPYANHNSGVLAWHAQAMVNMNWHFNWMLYLQHHLMVLLPALAHITKYILTVLQTNFLPINN